MTSRKNVGALSEQVGIAVEALRIHHIGIIDGIPVYLAHILVCPPLVCHKVIDILLVVILRRSRLGRWCHIRWQVAVVVRTRIGRI